METTLAKCSRKSRYGGGDPPYPFALHEPTRFVDDDQLKIDNDAAEFARRA